MNKVFIIGVGPGAPGYVTGEAQRALREAEIIVGWELNFRPVKSLVADKKVYIQEASNYLSVAREAAEAARRQGVDVAVLKIGDPCLSSGLDGTLEIFPDFEARIIPGISSVQMAAAAARINLDESVVISFHESDEPLEKKREFMRDAFRRGRHLIILTGQAQAPPETARYLIDSGVRADTAVLIGENMSLDGEKIFRGTLAEASTREYSWLSVMVVRQED